MFFAKSGRMRPRTVSIALALALASACGSEPDDTSTTTAASATTSGTAPAADCDTGIVRDVAYGTEPLQRLDVYPPPSNTDCSAPGMLWVHGGGWQRGDKSNGMKDKRAWTADLGYVLVSVNYRLTDPSDPETIRYPAHNEDVAAAVAFVVEHADDYGVDANRIAIMGHSAGAGIVAAVAADERYLGAHDLGLATLSCAAPLDTEGFDVAAAITGDSEELNGVYLATFGDDPSTWQEASPIEHLEADRGIAPMLLVSRGTPSRQATVEEFADALRAVDVPVTVVETPSYSHADVNSAIGSDDDTILTPALGSFLAECLA